MCSGDDGYFMLLHEEIFLFHYKEYIKQELAVDGLYVGSVAVIVSLTPK